MPAGRKTKRTPETESAESAPIKAEPLPRRRYTPEMVTVALKDTRGMVAVAARKLGCDRQTIYNLAKTDDGVREALVEAREFTTDTAELSLFSAIQKGEPWAVCFYLKTQGKNRGYVERHEHRHLRDIPDTELIDLVTGGLAELFGGDGAATADFATAQNLPESAPDIR